MFYLLPISKSDYLRPYKDTEQLRFYTSIAIHLVKLVDSDVLYKITKAHVNRLWLEDTTDSTNTMTISDGCQIQGIFSYFNPHECIPFFTCITCNSVLPVHTSEQHFNLTSSIHNCPDHVIV